MKLLALLAATICTFAACGDNIESVPQPDARGFVQEPIAGGSDNTTAQPVDAGVPDAPPDAAEPDAGCHHHHHHGDE